MDNLGAVLISIRPRWVELIAQGLKTLEVRKSRPAIEPPFTCYIYCAHGRYDDRVSVQSQTIWDEWRGRVIGEFTCKGVSYYRPGSGFTKDRMGFSLRMCSSLTVDDVWEYSGNGKFPLYGWAVDDLQIYKNPLILSAFCGLDGEPVKRAPQSWRYARKVVT